MVLSIPIGEARVACLESISGFVDAAGSCTELELLGASRCHGWTRLDVVVHVISGWQEMLGGLVSLVEEAPTVDAASYWPAFAEQYADPDDESAVATLMSQRRRTAAYLRPASALEQLRDLAQMLTRGVEVAEDRPRRWLDHVFTAGDFLTVWAVEHVVHHLDLLAPVAAPTSALDLTRRTVEALLGEPLPPGWSAEQAALVGTGRQAAPDDTADAAGAGDVAQRLPVLG